MLILVTHDDDEEDGDIECTIYLPIYIQHCVYNVDVFGAATEYNNLFINVRNTSSISASTQKWMNWHFHINKCVFCACDCAIIIIITYIQHSALSTRAHSHSQSNPLNWHVVCAVLLCHCIQWCNRVINAETVRINRTPYKRIQLHYFNQIENDKKRIQNAAAK